MFCGETRKTKEEILLKKRFITILISALMLVSMFAFGTTALAAGESLDVSTSVTELLEGGTVDFSAVITGGDTPLTGYAIVAGGTECFSTDATLAAGESVELSFSYNVTTEMLGTPIEFAFVSGGATLATDTITIAKKELIVKLAVSQKTSTNLADIGSVVTFSFAIENQGEAVIDNIIVKAPELNEGKALKEAFSLSPTQAHTVTFKHTMTGGITVNPTVTYSSGGVDQDPYILEPLTVNEAKRKVIPELTVDNANPQPGEEVTFTLTITNEGTVPYRHMKISLNSEEMDFPTSRLDPGDSPSEEYTMSFTTSTDVQFSISLEDHYGEIKNINSNAVSIQLPVDPEGLQAKVGFSMEVDRPQLTSAGTINFTGFVSNASEYALNNVSIDEPTIGNVALFPSLAAGGKENISWTADINETTTYQFTLTVQDREGREYIISAEPIEVTVHATAEPTQDITEDAAEITSEPLVADTPGSVEKDPSEGASDELGALFIVLIVLVGLIIAVGIALLVLWKKGKPRGKTSAAKMAAAKKKPAARKKSAPRKKTPKKTSKNYKDRNNF